MSRSPSRGEEIYAIDLLTWMRSIAPSIIAKFQASQALAPTPASPLVQFAQALEAGQPATLSEALSFLPQVADQRMPLIPWLQLNYAPLLTAQFGTLDVTYQQAFDAFQTLPTLNQHAFLLKDVYFNELIQTSIPAARRICNIRAAIKRVKHATGIPRLPTQSDPDQRRKKYGVTRQ